MFKYHIVLLLVVFALLLSGCSDDVTGPILNIKPEDRGPDIEPTATYDWMAGESPVPADRVGVDRYGVSLIPHAVSPNGVYFIQGSLIYYLDNGADSIVPLCGRVDCTHDNKDCNAYVYRCDLLTFHNGYLYAVGGNDTEEKCELMRMEPDGSEHVVVLDLLAFAKDNGGDFARCDFLMDGYCSFNIFHWVTDFDDGISSQMTGKYLQSYLFKLDGSMNVPDIQTAPLGVKHFCGDTLMCYNPDAVNGGKYGSIESGDLDERSATYLIDHPGITGYYDDKAGYYFKDGSIIRLDYATMEEEILVDTRLEGDYLLLVFPDCMIVASREDKDPDPNLYIYNWNYELVDTIEIPYSFNGATHFLLIAETAERLILTNTRSTTAMPKYYIDKSELGTGNATIHEFKYA